MKTSSPYSLSKSNGQKDSDASSAKSAVLDSDLSPLVFISWAPYCSRSDNIARELGGKSFMIYHAFWGSNFFTIAFKYLTQAIHTAFVLVRERPKRVLCMSPPVPTMLPVWCYCAMTGAKFGIDYHTAAFTRRSHRTLYPIQAFLSRRAVVNILTNSELSRIVEDWGGKTILIGDVRVAYANIEPYPDLQQAFNVTFVSRFSRMEPLDTVYAAAKELSSRGLKVHFYVTGDLRDAAASDVANCPENVTLTDFLSDAMYAGLLRDSDAALCLCLQDNTMQRGAYEAMALHTPLIVSDWKLLRDTFSRGTVYVPNTTQGIVEGVKRAIETHEILKDEIVRLNKERSRVWESKLAQIERSFA